MDRGFYVWTHTECVVSKRTGESEAAQHLLRFVCTSDAMCKVKAAALRVATTNLPILLLGETGTGKDVLARFVHANSNCKGPFVAVNCAALPESLVEGELFGHMRGAYTGAHEHARGVFDEAAGGTLFLDEVGELSPVSQAKLLRVLDTGEFRPLGGKSSRRVDVRILAASNRFLRDDAGSGERFRMDLLHRVAAVVLECPPLRERLEDIGPLAEHFLARSEKGDVKISSEAVELLKSHPWPGNVRQLRNVVLFAEAVCEDKLIEPCHLTEQLDWGRGQLSHLMGEAEREAVLAALGRAGGRAEDAAKLLGVSRATMYRKLKRIRDAHHRIGRREPRSKR